jgi:hypothetical protein
VAISSPARDPARTSVDINQADGIPTIQAARQQFGQADRCWFGQSDRRSPVRPLLRVLVADDD